MNSEEMLNVVRDYVMKARIKTRINKLCYSVSEGSCIGSGEFMNLVERQLVHTYEGFGAWRQLSDPEVLDGAYRYVTEGKRG